MGRENQKVKSTLQRMAQVQKDLDTAEAADVVKVCVKGTDDKYSYKTVTIS